MDAKPSTDGPVDVPSRSTIVQPGSRHFASTSGLARALGILLALYSVLAGLDALSTFVPAISLLAVLQIPTLIATYVLFPVWFYHSYRNLPALGATDLMATPGWAAGWLFVPFATLFRPFQVAREMWKASNPDVPYSTAEVRRHEKTWPILGWWWGMWLVSGWMDRIITQGSLHADPSTGKSLIVLAIPSDLLDILSAILALFVVAAISRRQDEKWSRMNALVLSPVAAATPEMA